jgi:penicillin-binding protein 1A
MIDGLVRFDQTQGWRGPVAKIDLAGDWGVKLAEVKALSDVAPWRLAVVLEVSDQTARIGLQPGREPGGFVSKERTVGILPLDGLKWAKTSGKVPTKVSQVVGAGDVVYVEPAKTEGQFSLRQVPEISGAMVVEDPLTGRVLAMVGGFSFDQAVQSRNAGAPAAGFVALRLCCRAGQRLHAVDHRARCAA